ncbi:MAG: biotin--[acetyl-CoA-carboxylase] ligase [Rickettsiales bacterium]|jgi:BirA family biotin operon repressor/biotin-[acetyl-CoA-carboxylase] ligase|nr:biotin--[acetyl-CoA-carboxylase] ligase [Rickettsiales bacterium]
MKFKVIPFKKVISTQIRARKVMDQGDFLCITADVQTGGYGQRGSKWKGDKKNLAYTLVLPLNFFENVYHINILTGICWQEILKKYKCDIKFKWSNDLYLNGKKLAGMLNEIEGGKVISGLGLNVEVAPKIKGKYKAVALKDVNPQIPVKSELLELFLKKFENALGNYKKNGIEKFFDKFKASILYVGEKVELQFNGKIIRGKFLGINEDGSCNIKTKLLKRRFYSGTLRPR